MNLESLLTEIYQPFGNEWVKNNDIVFTRARQVGLSLAGSIALAVGRKKAVKPPGDIDFVCDRYEHAKKFVASLEDYLLKKSVYWKVQVNSRTSFCPEGVIAHYRITVPFWLPICVMVLEKEVRFWRIDRGVKIQKFDDVVESAKSLDERDGKGRLDEEPRERPARILVDFGDVPDVIEPNDPHYRF